MFPLSPGSYSTIRDESYVVSGSGVVSGGIVISAKRGHVGTKVITSARQFINEYGLPSRDNPSIYAALRFLSVANVLTVRRVINDSVAATGALKDSSGDLEPLTVTASNPGAWGNDITVGFAKIVGAKEGTFALIVYEDSEEVERFEVSRDINAKDGYGNNVFIEDVVNDQSSYIRVLDDATVQEDYALDQVITLEGGSDDTIAPTSGQIITAWDDFSNRDKIQATLLINAGWTSTEVQSKMLAVAQARMNSVALLDIPKSTLGNVEAMIAYRNDELGANTYYGGIYAGWVTIFDQYNDREVQIPPSGDVAARFVGTVINGNRWDAPAGMQNGIISNAMGVSDVFSEGERDLLYTNGINPVTSFSGTNAVVWGQKTLQVQASAMDRFNVVNSVFWIRTSIEETLRAYVFKSNTKFNRDNINSVVSNYLENIKNQGGLYGYAVDTSVEINTPDVIDNNQMLIDVYIQPVRSAEFIKTSIIVTRTGVSLTSNNT